MDTVSEKIHEQPVISENTAEFDYQPKPVFDFVKRLFDLTASFVRIMILIIPFIIVSVLILIDDHGASPIFVQERVGKNGKIFKIYKFRTMCANAEEKLAALQEQNEMDGPVFKMKHDPRITRIGRFLRAFNIDELPQIFNIFLGQMSFVGPRPALPQEVAQYRPSDKIRLLVVPGLTCYWQTSHDRYSISFDEWMALDRKYIQERNILTDIKLILRTYSFLFRKNGY